MLCVDRIELLREFASWHLFADFTDLILHHDLCFFVCFLKRLDLIWMIKVFAERSIMSLGTQVVLLSNH